MMPFITAFDNQNFLSEVVCMRLSPLAVFGFSFILLLFAKFGYGQEKAGLPQKDSLKFNKLYEIVQKPVILSAGDYREAQELFLTAGPEEVNGEQCERLLAGAEEKINADINRINELFSFLQKLAEQLYARRICKIDPHAMAVCRRSLPGLNQRLQSRRKIRTFYANKKDRAVCREELANSLDILANHVSPQSFSSAWAVFEETFRQAYPLWNARYHELQKAWEPPGPMDVDRPRHELSAEERQFMYVFDKMQSGIRYLSASNSW